MARQKKKQPEQRQSEFPDNTQVLLEWLLEETDALKEILHWWKSREASALEAAERRPVFAGKTRNTGIRVNEIILQRAISKARQERYKTGGNISQLCEWLMWVYIGMPDDVVEHPHGAE